MLNALFTGYMLAILSSWLKSSFDNYQLKNRSLLARSKCDHCGKKLKWFNLFPILSYLFQGGTSTCCKKKVSQNYLYIESFTFLIGCIFVFFEFSLSSILLIPFLVILVFLDEKYQEIPIWLNALILLIVSLSKKNLDPIMLLNAGIIFLGLIIIYWLYKFFRKREGLGLGDIILIFSLSLYLEIPTIFLLISMSAALLIVKIIFSKDYNKPHAFGSWLSGCLIGFILFQEFYEFANSVPI